MKDSVTCPDGTGRSSESEIVYVTIRPERFSFMGSAGSE
jgi:hypothetical protein